MTFKECEQIIDDLINEAMYLRGTVLTLDSIYCEDEITDERLQIFWDNVLNLLNSITKNKKYIKEFTEIMHPYEYSVGQIQRKLMDLKSALPLIKVVKLSAK